MTLASLLRLNAASCLGFGLAFVLFPGAVSTFLGTFPPVLIVWLGAILMANGVHLVWASLRQPPALEVRYFALGDFLWVALSLALVASGGWIATGPGAAATLAVAAGVGAMGALQWRMAGQTTGEA